ncbi:Myosin-1 [Frankliniella fusca]|uniref:Myosin-1 n=1 Tax=Frankliniella fusca TaxID=407009 RepID=A0AAE1LTI2_9NEOP|nr:Myosin-1 [Frankliniella fusca]
MDQSGSVTPTSGKARKAPSRAPRSRSRSVVAKKASASDSGGEARDTGTSSLENHAKKSCPKLKDHVASDFVDLPADGKSKFVDMLAEMCAATLSSMNHVTHESFVAVIQTVVDLTVHARGRVDARELVPGGVNTISQRLEERSNEARA